MLVVCGVLGSGGHGIAVNSAAHEVYVANSEAATIDLFEEGPLPAVPVTQAGEVKGTGLVFKGTLAADTTGYYFRITRVGAVKVGPTTSPETGVAGPVSSEVTGLEPSTRYTYCLVASSKYGASVGSALSLQTGSVPVEISGESFSAVGPHGASLTAQVNPENLPGSYYYQYAPLSTFATAPAATATVEYEKQPFTATSDLTGLEPNTEYDVRLIATNTHGETTKGRCSRSKRCP